jgi:hypothetical protein
MFFAILPPLISANFRQRLVASGKRPFTKILRSWCFEEYREI